MVFGLDKKSRMVKQFKDNILNYVEEVKASLRKEAPDVRRLWVAWYITKEFFEERILADFEQLLHRWVTESGDYYPRIQSALGRLDLDPRDARAVRTLELEGFGSNYWYSAYIPQIVSNVLGDILKPLDIDLERLQSFQVRIRIMDTMVSTVDHVFLKDPRFAKRIEKLSSHVQSFKAFTKRMTTEVEKYSEFLKKADESFEKIERLPEEKEEDYEFRQRGYEHLQIGLAMEPLLDRESSRNLQKRSTHMHALAAFRAKEKLEETLNEVPGWEAEVFGWINELGKYYSEDRIMPAWKRFGGSLAALQPIAFVEAVHQAYGVSPDPHVLVSKNLCRFDGCPPGGASGTEGVMNHAQYWVWKMARDKVCKVLEKWSVEGYPMAKQRLKDKLGTTTTIGGAELVKVELSTLDDEARKVESLVSMYQQADANWEAYRKGQDPSIEVTPVYRRIKPPEPPELVLDL